MDEPGDIETEPIGLDISSSDWQHIPLIIRTLLVSLHKRLERIESALHQNSTNSSHPPTSSDKGSITWWHLRSVGNLKVLKVSYLTLAVIPLLSHYDKVLAFFNFKIWFLVTLFFASLFLALANLLYDIMCPTVVKRFASRNDLYKAMLDIKLLSSQAYSYDDFNGSLAHCTEAYATAAYEHPWGRLLCVLFYILACILFAVIFGYRSWLVLELLINSLCPHP